MCDVSLKPDNFSANAIIEKTVTEARKQNQPLVPHLYKLVQDGNKRDEHFIQEYAPYKNVSFTPSELDNFSLKKISKYQLLKKFVEIEIFFEFQESGYTFVDLEGLKKLCKKVAHSGDNISYFYKTDQDGAMYLYTFTEIRDTKHDKTTYVLLEDEDEAIEQELNANQELFGKRKLLQKNEVCQFFLL